MNLTAGFVSCFFSFPSLPWQHGTRQQSLYISGTQFPNLAVQFILSLSMSPCKSGIGICDGGRVPGLYFDF